MDINESILHELSLLRESVERIAEALENIDETLDEFIEIEEYDYDAMSELLGLEEDEDFDEEFEEDDFEEDFESEEQHD